MSVFSLGKTIKLLEKAQDQGVNVSFTDNELSVHVEKGKVIDPVLLQELKSNKPSLIYYFTNHVTNGQKFHLSQSIQKFDRTEIQNIPASFAQERLWFIDQLEGSVQYHLPSVFSLRGKINREALNFALQGIVSRHEVLRTVLKEVDGHALQYIKDNDGCEVNFIDGHEFAEDSEGLQQCIKELIRKPFNLANDYMLRIDLISVEEDQHFLIATMHHIASDAWSTPVLVKEVVELYSSFIENREPLLPPLRIQYADYAVWQRNYLQGDTLEKKLGYWKEKLKGLASLQLPTDFPRPVIQSTRGANAYFTIDRETTDRLHLLRQQQGSTLFMMLLAVFKIMLSRYSGQRDICVGTSIASREKAELEELIGFFVNTLALRTEVNMDASFADLLQQVKTTTLQAYEHQDVPFEKVVDAVLKERDTSRNPLFQVMLVLANTPETSQLKLGELDLSRESYQPNISKFDLTFFINESSGGLQCSVQYCTDLFREESITRMITHFRQLVSTISLAPHRRIGSLCMLTESEQQQLLVGFNQVSVTYPKEKSIVDLFEEQAAKTPDALALLFDDERLTYRALNERSNQLAHYLRNMGIQEDSLVPLCVERSHYMIIGILGILKAGGAYVPMEPDFPQDRKSFVLKDTNASIVVSTQESSSTLSFSDIDIVEIDSLFSPVKVQPLHNVSSSLKPHHLAYVIYTSGSTGRPKGVMIEHRNLVDYVFGLKQATPIDDCESFALVSSIATDLGNTVIYSSLVFGGALHVFSKESVSNIEYLHNYFTDHRIDCLKIVPSHWKALSAGQDLLLPARMLIFGGEALQSEWVEQIRLSGSRCIVVNHYGPTETTIGKLLHVVSDDIRYNKTIPIGKPFSNSGAYVLSGDMELCPVGVPGQLYIWGDGVARGYLNNGELTDQKFINRRFDRKDRRPMYATGDLVRWLADGNIEFIGRVDDQVKIRGYRVELGEIESALLQVGGVKQAVVISREDKDGNKRLVSYIVGTEDYEKESVVNALKDILPDYMVPGQWVEMESFPLLPNGKVDKKSLPDPELSEHSGGQYVAPRNEVESTLADLWKDVLEIDQVGIYDDFFELGGHSLLAVRLISSIRKGFSVEMPIGRIFDYPTIALLAEQIQNLSGTTLLPTIKTEPRSENIPLSFSQERIWFIDRLEGSVQYHVSTVLRLKGKLEKDALEFALRTVVNRHEVLRTVIREIDGDAYQTVKEKDRWELSFIEGSDYKHDNASLKQFVQNLIRKPFDLATDDMMRGTLIALDDEEHVLVVTIHHIASDGWSKSILVKEVVALYGSYINGLTSGLSPIEIQYADYAIWQRKYLEGEVLDQKIAYWKNKLQGVAPLQLPTDFPRPPVQGTRGSKINFTLPRALSLSIEQLSQQEGCTVFMTLLSAFKVLLYRYSGQQDICVGTPIANRLQQELEGLIGFFVNTLALRSEVNGNSSFTELLQQVRTNTTEAYQNQEAPFEKVVEAVVKGRDMSRNPLFQVMFVLRNTPEVPELRMGELAFSPMGFEHTTSLFDLTLFITETGNGLECSLEYNTDLYTAETIKRFVGHFKELLHAVVQSPGERIATLPMLTKAEEHKLLVEFNNTYVAYPRNKSIINLFEEQVLKTPDDIALVFEGQELCYRELNAKANQLAHYLRANGVKEDTPVPICIERGLEMVIGVVGILKAGAAYVPIDPDYPEERINYMLSDTDAALMITSTASKSKLANKEGARMVEIDAEWEVIGEFPSGDPQTHREPHHAAYVLYTSGSTGRPKGVKMPGGALVNLLMWQQKQFENKKRRVLQFASLNFDVSFQEIFSTICFGSTLFLISGARRKDLSQVLEEIGSKQVTHLFLPFIVLKNLAEYALQLSGEPLFVEEIIVAGEQLKLTDDILSLMNQNKIRIINQYGPTEAHVVSSYTIPQGQVLPPLPPIGKPIDNTTLYILREGNLVPVGVAGELYIGGAQVALGYLNRPELTAERFIDDPFSGTAGARLYKTGDLARWLPDGNIEYLGRIDNQVKIRGFRIELGEIEAVVQECGLVRQAVVLAVEDGGGNKRLVSYVVPEGSFDREALLAHARSKLPEYMVPALWVSLESMPITSNGKVDKGALPDPGIGQQSKTEYVAPVTEMELILTEMWQELLGVERIGIHDNFFELGGHSLMVIKMVSNIKKRFLLSIPISALFQFTSIKELSNYLEWEIHSVKESNTNPEPNKIEEEDKSSFEVINL